MKQFLIILLVCICFFAPHGSSKQKNVSITVQGGSKVSLEYTLVVDGEIVDTSHGKKPLEYVHGEGRILPALSKQLEGLKVGDEKEIVLTPEEAYGLRDPNGLKEIPRTELPPDIDPEVDMVFRTTNRGGTYSLVKVAEVKDGSVVIDFNHPLAGKNLNFKVRIVSID